MRRVLYYLFNIYHRRRKFQINDNLSVSFFVQETRWMLWRVHVRRNWRWMRWYVICMLFCVSLVFQPTWKFELTCLASMAIKRLWLFTVSFVLWLWTSVWKMVSQNSWNSQLWPSKLVWQLRSVTTGFEHFSYARRQTDWVNFAAVGSINNINKHTLPFCEMYWSISNGIRK